MINAKSQLTVTISVGVPNGITIICENDDCKPWNSGDTTGSGSSTTGYVAVGWL